MDNVRDAQRGFGGGRFLFLSYAREDRDVLRPLEEGIEVLHHRLWVDHKLEAGHAWWNDIIDHIQACDAMLIALSPSLLDSEAAALERRYARELGKPLIPVVVAEVPDDILPADIAGLQFVDFVRDPRAPFHLANVLSSLPPTPQLPDPLPQPPPVPISYMAGLADKIRQPQLSYDEQMALVGSLRASLEQPKERVIASKLLAQLAERHDLYSRPGKEIDRLLLEGHARPSAAEPTAQDVPEPPRSAATAPETAGRFSKVAPSAAARPSAQRIVQPRPEPVLAPSQPVYPSPGQRRTNAAGPPRPEPPGPDPSRRAQAPSPPPRRLGLTITATVLTVLLLILSPGIIELLIAASAVVALYSSLQVKSRWNRENLQGARTASTTALVTGIVSLILFGLAVLLLAALTV